MVIEFQCPQGHNLSCPDERAGKTAKCPKCGSEFHVPDPAEIPKPLKIDTNWKKETDSPNVFPVDETAFGSKELTTSSKSPSHETIEFLCPNGHELKGPLSLQGRPGKCPHCGAKFRVPLIDSNQKDTEEEFPAINPTEDVDEQIVDFAVGDSSEAPPTEFPLTDSPGTSGAFVAIPDPEGEENQYEDDFEGAQSTPEMFNFFWSHKQQGASIVLLLQGGESFTPEWFSRELSTDDYGVFGAHDEDLEDKVEIVAIAWDQIHRITVRDLDYLPEEYFE